MKTIKHLITKKVAYVLVIMVAAAATVLFYSSFLTGEPLRAENQKWNAVTHDKTNFPLVGKHRTVPCSECHLKGVMQGTPTECEACHWYRKQDDRYKLQLGLQCDQCHTPFDWKRIKPNTWDHQQVTGFRLEGIHKTLDCFQCHKETIFSPQPGDCYDCHREDYREASEPNHAANGFPSDCKACHHSMLTWEGAHYDHSAFPLKGNHKTADCASCHQSGVYQGLPSQCVDCHIKDYNATSNPNHRQAGYSTDCERCHGSDALTWTGAKVDHSVFPLRGKHLTADCGDCHVNGQYTGILQECSGCHMSDYNATTNPNHKKAGYSTDCESCHGNNADAWTGVKVNHSAFPLRGKHLTADCGDCHINGQYAGTPQECSGCHLADYNATTNPNHQQAGYSTDCESCHGSSADTWTGANSDHSVFPLLGKHQTADCGDCHKNGQYTGTPQACSGCHMADYNATTNPNHQQAGYSTDCESCHGNSADTWTGAKVDHSNFPLNGKHKTADCSDCHKNGQYTGTPQECSGCHMAEYNATTDPNHQAAGFSTDCVTCHGTGAVSWEGAVFDHNQFWPLKGAHTGLDCSTCHSAGYDLPTDCYGCHQQDYQNAKDPDHKSAGFPTTCESCHFSSHVSWSQAVFNHQFPIYSGNHRGLSCTECHLTANFQVFSCLDCHEHNKNDMDKEHHDVGGYSYNSQACYTCHPTGRGD